MANASKAKKLPGVANADKANGRRRAHRPAHPKPIPLVPPDARAVSMPQAARVTGLSERTLYSRIASGALRALRTGNRTLITVVELDRFLGVRN